jgi:hypothetical protein
MCCRNETSEMSAECRKLFRSSCRIAPVSFCRRYTLWNHDYKLCVVPFCWSYGRIFEFVSEQCLWFAYSSPHTHTYIHTHIHTHTHTHTHKSLVLIFRFFRFGWYCQCFPCRLFVSLSFAKIFSFEFVFCFVVHLRGFRFLVCVGKLCSFVYYVTKKC